MIPVVVIVGRPNVGKSTLFNRLTNTKDALVADMPGVTRDRQYGEGVIAGTPAIIVDTGGMTESASEVADLTHEQAEQAIKEADILLFMVDAHAGITSADEEIADIIRRSNKKVILVANKSDGVNTDLALAEFYSLGFGEPQAISASQGRGVTQLSGFIVAELPVSCSEPPEKIDGIKVAMIGKPNVGKSTLVNRVVGEERVIVCDMPGTTRDSIFVPIKRRDKDYVLIDTAGIRRRRSVNHIVEKFSIVKAMKAISQSNVVVFVIDARENIAEQDLRLLGLILDAGKALVIAVNKWDGLENDVKERVKSELDRRLSFIDFAKIVFISALHGTGVGDVFDAVNKAYASAMRELPTSFLNRLLSEAIEKHEPPLVRGRRIKLRYAHAGGHNPPCIVIHGNQVDDLPSAYKRYLAKYFRKRLKMVGTPIRIELKATENPFAGRKNQLTPTQQKKRQRMLKHVKKSK